MNADGTQKGCGCGRDSNGSPRVIPGELEGFLTVSPIDRGNLMSGHSTLGSNLEDAARNALTVFARDNHGETQSPDGTEQATHRATRNALQIPSSGIGRHYSLSVLSFNRVSLPLGVTSPDALSVLERVVLLPTQAVAELVLGGREQFDAVTERAPFRPDSGIENSFGLALAQVERMPEATGLTSLIESVAALFGSPHFPPAPFPPVPPPGFPRFPGSVEEFKRRLEEFIKRLAEWIRRVRAIWSRYASEAADWNPSPDPRQKIPAHPEDYTDPPEVYPETDCPFTYHSSSSVKDTVLLAERSIKVKWTRLMAAAWDDTGDPFGDPVPRPTPEELRKRYGEAGHKPSVNAVTAAVRGYLKRLAESAAELNTLGTLPEGLKGALALAAQSAAGKCPANCPVRDVQLVGWDIYFGCHTQELFFYTLSDGDGDGLDDTWEVTVTVKLWCHYHGTIYYDVTCYPGT